MAIVKNVKNKIKIPKKNLKNIVLYSKRVLWGVIAFLLCLCLVPVPMSRNDGGTVEYCAVLYRYIVWKELAPEETGEEYLTGTTLDLFPNNFTRRAHAPGYPE